MNLVDLAKLSKQETMPLGSPARPFLTKREVLDAHAEFGRVDWHMVKEAMGPNWPAEWEAMSPGEGIFEPDEDRR